MANFFRFKPRTIPPRISSWRVRIAGFLCKHSFNRHRLEGASLYFDAIRFLTPNVYNLKVQSNPGPMCSFFQPALSTDRKGQI